MIARFGSTEMSCLTNYIGVKYKDEFKDYKKYVKGETPPWWWGKINNFANAKTVLDFFPPETSKIEQFCKLLLSDAKEVDILGSWLHQEKFVKNNIKQAKQIVLEDMEPFFTENPWTKALEGKKSASGSPFFGINTRTI